MVQQNLKYMYKCGKDTHERGDDSIENELFVGHQLVTTKGRNSLEEERCRTREISYRHFVKGFVRSKTILPFPITSLKIFN